MAYDYLTEAGAVVPDTSDVLETVRDEYRAALGDDLDVSDSTPQGLLIAAETAARMTVLRNNAAVANQINPDIAGGIFLDAIAALTRLSRAAATPSLLRSVALTGVPGTIIPAGSVALVGANGPEFASISEVTLDAGGAATVDFQAIETGATAVAIGALDTIGPAAVLGWETVSNPTAAEVGQAQQSDLSFRALRRNTLALQGVSLVEAITSALHAIEGVKSLAFRENVTSSPATIDGILLAAHSVWACVDGGSDADIAGALLDNKSLGAGWNGATSVGIVEPSSGQTYTVQFDRPVEIAFQARVTVSQGSATVNPLVAIPEAMAAYAQGDGETFGEPGLGVGDAVSPFELAGAINIVHPGFFVRKVEIKPIASGAFSTDEYAIALDEVATLTAASVQVIVV